MTARNHRFQSFGKNAHLPPSQLARSPGATLGRHALETRGILPEDVRFASQTGCNCTCGATLLVGGGSGFGEENAKEPGVTPSTGFPSGILWWR